MTLVNIAKKIAKNTIWSALGAASSQGALIISTMACARILSDSDLGKLIFINGIATTIGMIISSSIGVSTINSIATSKNNLDQKLRNIITLNLLGSIILGGLASLAIAFGAKAISTKVFNDTSLIKDLQLASAAILFIAIDGFYKNLLVGQQKIKLFATCSAYGALASSITMIGITLKFGQLGVSLAILMGSFMQATISTIIFRKTKSFTLKPNGFSWVNEWKTLASIGLPSLLANSMVTPAHLINQATLGSNHNGFAEIAIYGISMNWYNAILFIPQATGKVVTPLLIQLFSESNKKSTQKLLLASIIGAGLTAIPGTLLITAFSKQILLAYNIRHEYGTQILSTIAVAAAISAIQNPVGNMIAATSKFWQGFIMNASWACIFISSAYIMKEDGALGVARGLLIAYTTHLIWTIAFSLKQLSSKSSIPA